MRLKNVTTACSQDEDIIVNSSVGRATEQNRTVGLFVVGLLYCMIRIGVQISTWRRLLPVSSAVQFPLNC